MYKPRLKYVFCLMRKRSLSPALSVMRYLNSVGITPRLLITGQQWGSDPSFLTQRTNIRRELKLWGIKYEMLKSVPNDYDVMFCEGMGSFNGFEKTCLTKSKQLHKKNVMLVNSISPWRNEVNPYFLPEKTGLLDGICMRMNEHLLHYKEFTKNLFLINVGDPDWDWWTTSEFKKEVAKTNAKFGKKILLYCGVFATPDQAIPYVRLWIKQAERLGFKFMINPHPDRWKLMPLEFVKYCNRHIDHHVLFKAASHIVSSPNCSVLMEGLLLGTKAGSTPLIAHCAGHGQHRWLDKKAWHIKVPKHIKPEIFKMIPPIFDEKDMINFLSSPVNVSAELVKKELGIINVPNYSEYLFKTLDEKCGNY